MSNRRALLWFFFPFASIPLLMLWPLWLLVAIGWLIARCFRPEGVQVTERNCAIAKANASGQRIYTAIQMQLAAHGLPDTPRNRSMVAMAINRRPR